MLGLRIIRTVWWTKLKVKCFISCAELSFMSSAEYGEYTAYTCWAIQFKFICVLYGGKFENQPVIKWPCFEFLGPPTLFFGPPRVHCDIKRRFTPRFAVRAGKCEETEGSATVRIRLHSRTLLLHYSEQRPTTSLWQRGGPSVRKLTL